MKKSGKSMTYQQMLAKCISDYNARVHVRKWKVDPRKKKIIQNLLKCPADFIKILTSHYDKHRHANSGAPRFSMFLCTVKHGWFVFCKTFALSYSLACCCFNSFTTMCYEGAIGSYFNYFNRKAGMLYMVYCPAPCKAHAAFQLTTLIWTRRVHN